MGRKDAYIKEIRYLYKVLLSEQETYNKKMFAKQYMNKDKLLPKLPSRQKRLRLWEEFIEYYDE